jgi:hypothetical protein
LSYSYADKSWQEIFANEISLISSTEAKLILNAIFEKVQDKHKIAPASSTGKYHPGCSLGDGGLIRHIKFVTRNVMELIKATPEVENEKDELIVAAILHDLCKYPNGDADKYTAANHPTIMAKIIVDTCPSSEMAKTIARLVACHQGRAEWNRDKKTGELINPSPKEQDEYVLHYADLLASRPYLNPGFDETGNIILDPCENRGDIIKESCK